MRTTSIAGCFLLFVWSLAAPLSAQEGWKRWTIDNTSRGADGIRVADFNGDGRPDLVTGWEEGGQVAFYLHPGPKAVKHLWPKTVVGNVKSPEDAVFVDINGDGQLEVLSCCEGKNRSIFLHQRNDATGEWSTSAIPSLQNKAMWMFAVPMDVNDDGKIDIVAGAKGTGAELGWIEGTNWAESKWHTLSPVGWVMSIEAVDMNGDGHLDILFSDRKGNHRGIHWLEHPESTTGDWIKHTVGGTNLEVMFLSQGDINHDGKSDLACAVKGADIQWFERVDDNGLKWQPHEINMPANTGSGKGVAIGDIDGDGQNDIVFTCEHSEQKHGAGWLKAVNGIDSPTWEFHPISGSAEGIK
ncbi:MAG: VCBS repeat-containing protein, partial [Planctomycetaceae bacterium]|nr:VCBS repeat-containing protein [Planctomycetaceae bacterium]